MSSVDMLGKVALAGNLEANVPRYKGDRPRLSKRGLSPISGGELDGLPGSHLPRVILDGDREIFFLSNPGFKATAI